MVFLLGAVEFTGKVFQKCALAEYRPVFLFVLFAACAVRPCPALCARPSCPPPGWRWVRRWGRAAPFPPF